MKKRTEIKKGNIALKIIGWLITIFGFSFLFIKAFGNLTGFVVSQSVEQAPSYSYLFAILAVIFGVLLMRSRNR